MQTVLPEILEDLFESFSKRNEKFHASYLIIPLSDQDKKEETDPLARVHVPFKSPEIYLLRKSFVNSGDAPDDSYKSLFDKTAPRLANKKKRVFRSGSLQKCIDKVDPESKENVKRFL